MRYIPVLLGLSCLVSCSKSVSDQIISSIERECSAAESCYVDIRHTTKGEWDRLYVFSELATHSDVVKQIGPTTLDPELKGLLIFTQDARVVQSEYLEVHPEYGARLSFRFPLDQTVMIFRSNESRFRVKILTNGRRKFYELSPP